MKPMAVQIQGCGVPGQAEAARLFNFKNMKQISNKYEANIKQILNKYETNMKQI